MSVKIILKNPPQQNYVNIFLAGLISTIWTFDGMANKHDVCRSEDCMKVLQALKRGSNADN